MKKHNYRTKKINEINWQELSQQFAGEAVTFATVCRRISPGL